MKLISAFATDVVKRDFFKSQADTFLNRLPLDKFEINQRHKTATKSISGVLVGHVVETFYNIKFLELDILDRIDKTIKKHKDLHDDVCKLGYQKLSGSWVVYHEGKYETVIEEFELNDLHEYISGVEGLGVSLTKKKCFLNEIEVHEERGYKWISNDSYYGKIILRLENLKKKYQKFINDGAIVDFLSYDCVSDLILFTNISNPFYHSRENRNKFETHFYDSKDVIYVQELLKNTPIIEYKKNYISRPSLRFEKHKRFSRIKYELLFRGTPDFIIDNYIVDIKVTNSISRSDYYQVLFYYILAKYGYGDNYPKIKGCKLVYVKHNKIVSLDFSKIIFANEGEVFNDYIVDNIFADFIKTEAKRAIEREKIENRKKRLKEKKAEKKLKKQF